MINFNLNYRTTYPVTCLLVQDTRIIAGSKNISVYSFDADQKSILSYMKREEVKIYFIFIIISIMFEKYFFINIVLLSASITNHTTTKMALPFCNLFVICIFMGCCFGFLCSSVFIVKTCI